MKEREMQGVSLPWLGIPRLMPFIRPHARRIVIMILMGCASSAVDAVYPLFNRYAITHFIGEGTLAGLGLFAAAYIALRICQAATDFKNLTDCGKVEMYMDRDLRNAAFSHLQTLSLSYFSRNSVGYIHSRVMSDTGTIGELVAWRMMDFVWSAAYIAGAMAVMLSIRRQLALWLLALLAGAALIMTYFQKQILALNRKIREINGRITGEYNEAITGIDAIRSLNLQGKMQRDFGEETLTMKRTAIREGRCSACLIALVVMMSSVALALVLWKGGRLTKEGLMEVGTLSVFMSYALGMLDPLQNIIRTLSAALGIQVNIERLTRLLGEMPEVADAPEVSAIYGDTFSPKKENWEPLLGDVEFRDVTFRYPDGDENVLEHFSLKVKRGTNVAIVGETGAGKSTLVNLVCRFYEPTEGQLLIDGRDARERSQQWLHSHIGYVLQTPHLFSGTVRENLCYGRPDATDEEIREAVRLVGAAPVIERMGQGLDSDVGEGGGMLSAGEKQLLSLARALLADPAILILDEATSSIDTVTEKALQSAIATVIRGRTSFVIAHRLSTITEADVIVVVRDGKIIGQGTHRELMKQKGYYSRLYRRQFEELAADGAGE